MAAEKKEITKTNKSAENCGIDFGMFAFAPLEKFMMESHETKWVNGCCC